MLFAERMLFTSTFVEDEINDITSFLCADLANKTIKDLSRHFPGIFIFVDPIDLASLSKNISRII